MTLYNNGIVILDYDETFDLLDADCPDLREMELIQVHDALKKISSAIGAYSIRNLLLDFSKTTIDTSDENYIMVIDLFVNDLKKTCLRRIARVASKDADRENRLSNYYEELKEKEKKVSIYFQNFPTKATALDWLTLPEQDLPKQN